MVLRSSRRNRRPRVCVCSPSLNGGFVVTEVFQFDSVNDVIVRFSEDVFESDGVQINALDVQVDGGSVGVVTHSFPSSSSLSLVTGLAGVGGEIITVVFPSGFTGLFSVGGDFVIPGSYSAGVSI